MKVKNISASLEKIKRNRETDDEWIKHVLSVCIIKVQNTTTTSKSLEVSGKRSIEYTC